MPAQPLIFLNDAEVIAIHADVLGQSWEDSYRMLLGGGLAKLQGALARPEQYVRYQTADRALLATVLAHGIVEAHAFQDGNKRAAHASMHVFLDLNGRYTTMAPKRVRERWMIQLATHTPLEDVAASVREHLVKLP
jgi:prophage maintenance system killer protein